MGKDSPSAPLAEVEYPRRVESSRADGDCYTSEVRWLEAKLGVGNVDEGVEHRALGEDIFEVLADNFSAVC